MKSPDRIDLRKLEFEFDLNGFTVVRDYLSESDVDRMNAAIERSGLESALPKFHFIETDSCFFDLIFDPLVLSLCSRWIAPTFRFDHAWGVHHPPSPAGASAREGLHAGPYQNQGFFQYHWYNNRPQASCIVFSYVLKDQPSENGGLVLLPGSHKLNVPITDHVSREVLERFYGRDFSAIDTLARPSLRRGDLLIMAEATVHGTAPWKCATSWRRNIYYKYCYGFMGWLPNDDEVIARLRSRATTDPQKRVLEAPYVSRASANVAGWRAPVFSDDPPNNK